MALHNPHNNTAHEPSSHCIVAHAGRLSPFLPLGICRRREWECSPLDERHFPNLEGGHGNIVSRGRGGCGKRFAHQHRLRSRKHEARSHSRRAPGNRTSTTVLVAEQPASWAKRCSISKAWSPCALTYFAPVIKDGVKVVVCPPEEVAKAATNWERVLMGYFVGFKPYVPALARYFKRLWMIKGDLQVLSMGNGFLLFKFSNDGDKKRALEEGPWFVRGKPLVLRPWTINSKFEKDKLLTIPIWVKFPKLALQFWSPTLIDRVASTLGTPLYMDEATTTSSRVDFAHVCIEISSSFSFPRTTHLEVDGIEVDYDWEPMPCQRCSSFGHEPGSCVSVSTTLAALEVNSSHA